MKKKQPKPKAKADKSPPFTKSDFERLIDRAIRPGKRKPSKG